MDVAIFSGRLSIVEKVFEYFQKSTKDKDQQEVKNLQHNWLALAAHSGKIDIVHFLIFHK